MKRFFIENLDLINSKIVIKGSEYNHIVNVLRLKQGDKIILIDGKGNEYESCIDEIMHDYVKLSILSSSDITRESPVKILIAQALLKEKKMDLILRQLIELGINGWVPFIAQRSIPKLDKNAVLNRKTRWQKIVMESLKQCKRNNLPDLIDIISFKNVLSMGKDFDLKIIFWENSEKSLKSIFSYTKKNPERIMMIIGPEGGFTFNEMEKAYEYGFIDASLGYRILKADTASIAACTILQYVFGDIG